MYLNFFGFIYRWDEIETFRIIDVKFVRRANLCRAELGYHRERARNWRYISHDHSFPPWLHSWTTNTRLGLRIAVSAISVSAEKRRFFRNHEVWVSSTRDKIQIPFHFVKSRRVLRLTLKDPKVSDVENVTYLISSKFISKSSCSDYQW